MADYHQNQNHFDNRNGQPDWYQDPGPQNEYHNPYNPYPKQPKKERNGFATAARISGMPALINLCCFAFTTAIIFGVGAVSFALVSKKEQKLSTPARIAIFLGIGAVVFGVIEYFVTLNMIEIMKAPENIAQVNKFIEEAEKMLESQAALRESLTH